ncbi:hypothetical protein ACKXF4_06540 [Faecalibacterium prausnitzii]|uniref:hypothetical protein n=1 Tax=Faecalibacterium prausnitzii TaxID=853 RepID=UPI003AAF89FB
MSFVSPLSAPGAFPGTPPLPGACILPVAADVSILTHHRLLVKRCRLHPAKNRFPNKGFPQRVKAFAPDRLQKLIPLPAGFIKVSLCGFPTAILFYACSSVCRELSVKFVRFYKNAISRVFLGRNFKKPLAISVPKWYVVSNKSETWIHLHFGAANSAPHTLLFFTLLFSSFTFLSFTLPVPQGTRKAMTHLHGSSLFLLPTAARRGAEYKPQKHCSTR